ncbi:hypothetical protein NEMBOFW57_002981 [Staphylotrichum longicolle]|uniref:Uncharacterized protein n=1 Tax=Staphylotrichum longicolle TaxID=669026 RepID=A0AAD4I2X6_9PEZI|nr:hypothetical protein NEMBOFW57_002981 [Staphylotrichum longicolle]
MNEQYATPTLRQVLTQQKLPVPCRASAAASRNTIGWTWPDLEVAVWDEFNLANLNESYGHILALEVQRPYPRADQLLQGLATNSAADVKELIGWNDGLLRPVLERAKSHLGLYPGTVLHHVHSTADQSVIAKLRNVRQRLTVDHIIGLDDFPIQNLVVGLGRPSRKWSGGTLANQIQSGSVTGELLWPVRQLANICDKAGTRYGYIQTDEELVVFCYSKRGAGWKAAFMPIPWSRHGAEVLTSDLALWWLCMLAMSPSHHRAVTNEEDMVKINDWDLVYQDHLGGWVRRHRYSNFEEPADPPPPPTYETPSPGNQAAFEAGVGLHANKWFDIGNSFDLDYNCMLTHPEADLGPH